MQYIKSIIGVICAQSIGWWVTLVVMYLASTGIFANYESIRTSILDKFCITLPSEFPVSWLVWTLVIWLLASLLHKEVMRKHQSGRVIFEDPYIVPDVPLYSTVVNGANIKRIQRPYVISKGIYH